MFKPTPSLQKMLRRLPLSPKQAGKEYYKGNRVGSMGTIDQYGRFSPVWSKIRSYVVPERNLPACKLTPFVAETTDKTRQTEQGKENYPKRFTGEEYLRAWKLAGGHDTFAGVSEDSSEQMLEEDVPERTEERRVAKS